MSAVASYAVDRAAAATLREWLFDPAVEKHGESNISEPLAEAAAAIHGGLHEQAESIELGTRAQTVPPIDQDASLDDRGSADDYHPDDGRSVSEFDGLEEDLSEPDYIYREAGELQRVASCRTLCAFPYASHSATTFPLQILDPHVRQKRRSEPRRGRRNGAVDEVDKSFCRNGRRGPGLRVEQLRLDLDRVPDIEPGGL